MARLGFLGVGGSGKTTLVQYLLKEEVVNLPFLPSCVSCVLAKNGILCEQDFRYMSPSHITLTQFDIFYERINEEKRYKNFVSDRTLLDIYLHTLYRCSSYLLDSEYKDLQIKTHDSLLSYDYLFYLSLPEHINFSDKKRIQTKAGITVVVTLYRKYIEEFNLSEKAIRLKKYIHYVRWDSLENRAQQVQKIMENKNENSFIV